MKDKMYQEPFTKYPKAHNCSECKSSIPVKDDKSMIYCRRHLTTFKKEHYCKDFH